MTTTSFELDRDTAVTPGGDGRYAGDLVEGWNMNGGYLAVFCLRAVLADSPLPDPLSMTVHYLSPPVPGPAEVRVTVARLGRGHATHRFDLVQRHARDQGRPVEDRVHVTGLVLTGRLRQPGPLDFAPEAPLAPGPEQSSALKRISAPAERVDFWGRLERRVARPEDVFFMRAAPGEARTGGWTRLADGRPSDALCVPLFLDCWPPAVFSRTLQADEWGAPTLELTVHWRNAVPPGWLNARFHTRQLSGGYIDEHGELWSEDGVLVADSRQLARYSTGDGDAGGRAEQ